MEFELGEFVMIKRTSGKWEEGEIINVMPDAVTVKVKVTDNFRGLPYNGPVQDGFKTINREKYNTHLMKMKRRA